MNVNGHKQNGQSATGLLIAALFFLVPLFIGVVYISKIVDTKHKVQEGARYAAWERAVYRPSPTGRYVGKSNQDVQREIQKRVFGSPSDLLNSREDRRLVRTANIVLNPIQYTSDWSRAGNRVPILEEFNGQRDQLVSYNFSERAPSGRAQRAIQRVVRAGLRLPSSTIQSSEVSVQLVKLPQFDLGNADFRMSSRNVMLAGTWNTDGPSGVRRSVSRVVPTTLMDNSLVRMVQNLAGVGFREVRPSSLDWGRIEPDHVPGQRLRR